MQLLDSFTPTTWKCDNENDQDLASTAPVLLPNGTVFQVGKLRTAYVLNAVPPGRHRRPGGRDAPTSAGTTPTVGRPRWTAPSSCPAATGSGRSRRHPTSPRWPTWKTTSGAHSSPIVAGGMVWSIGGGTLYALNPPPATSSTASPLGGPANHFPSPAAAEGLVVAPAIGPALAFDGPAGLPGPPTPAPDPRPATG